MTPKAVLTVTPPQEKSSEGGARLEFISFQQKRKHDEMVGLLWNIYSTKNHPELLAHIL